MKWRNMLMVSLIFPCLYAMTFTDAEIAPSLDANSVKCNSTDGCYYTDDCQEVCGCDGVHKFDEDKGECVIDYEYLKNRTRSSNLMQTENDNIEEDDLTKKIRETTERVFQGVIYCAIFFIVCASVCVISACAFCCHIHYSDEKLKNEVKALAKKSANPLKVDYKKKESFKNSRRDPKQESCNVIIEDANVLCV